MTRINVTAEHISGGERESCSRCPIALAVRDAFPGARFIEVGAPDIRFWNDAASRWMATDLPASAQEFMVTFDAGVPVEPFSFDVRRPAAIR